MNNSPKTPALDVVVAGYLGVDIAPGFPSRGRPVPASELFRPGKLIDTEGISISLGGVVANTGMALKRFGLRVELMGCIGHDTLGDIVAARLREEKVPGGVRRNPRAGTAYGIVIAPPGADRMFLEDAGCNAVFTAADIDYGAVARSRLFHFGYPTLMRKMWANDGEELRRIFKRVRSLGVATSLDMALPDPSSPAAKADWRNILVSTLPFVDIFVPSLEEILFLMDRPRYERILAKAAGRDLVEVVPEETFDHLAEELLAMGVRILMIKSGHRGAYIRTADVDPLVAETKLKLASNAWNHRRLWAESLPVDSQRFKNACGAGDAAVAGFLTAVLRGADLGPAAAYAMLAGRDSLYGTDACSGLSGWRRMTRMVQQQARQRGGRSHGSYRD